MAFTFDRGEEIAADAMDMKGDRERSVRNLAIILGRGKALRTQLSCSPCSSL